MKNKTLFTILFATLAVYGCSSDSGGGAAGSGGSAGTGGSAGEGGAGGSAGEGGAGGSAGTGGSAGEGGTGGMAADVVYEQDFESLDIDGETIGDGWLFFVNVFDGDDVRKFGYGGAAPNGPQICALASGEGGSSQGIQQLDVYSDYDCCDLAPPPEDDQGHGNGTDRVETNVFQERTVAAGDVGKTFSFSFDAKRGNINSPSGSSTANAFIKTLDPDAGFTVSESDTEDTTDLMTTWVGFTVSIEITAALEGHILQFGFQTNASDFESSGVFYDNVVLTESPTAP